jgi:hypothetical protein
MQGRTKIPKTEQDGSTLAEQTSWLIRIPGAAREVQQVGQGWLLERRFKSDGGMEEGVERKHFQRDSRCVDRLGRIGEDSLQVPRIFHAYLEPLRPFLPHPCRGFIAPNGCLRLSATRETTATEIYARDDFSKDRKFLLLQIWSDGCHEYKCIGLQETMPILLLCLWHLLAALKLAAQWAARSPGHARMPQLAVSSILVMKNTWWKNASARSAVRGARDGAEDGRHCIAGMSTLTEVTNGCGLLGTGENPSTNGLSPRTIAAASTDPG